MMREHRWPMAIVALLTIFVAANLMVMRLAGADPSFAIEPDYYQKAVAFDSTMAVERRSGELRWTAASRMTRRDSGMTLTVVLADRSGAPVTGAAVSISARFNARANDVLLATLSEAAAGRYEAPLDARHAGQWEVRVNATRGADRFVASTRVEAPALP
jgi:nitrogen fixation protein FixH